MEADDDKTFPELLEAANFQHTSKKVWQFEINGHNIAFIGSGDDPLDYKVRVTGFTDFETDVNDLWLNMLSIEKFVNWVRINSHQEEAPGFSQDIEIADTKQHIQTAVAPTVDRKLTILTWGIAKMNHKPDKSQRNWFVGVITARKYGVDTRKNDGRTEEIQSGIMTDSKFQEILDSIVTEVEKNNYTVISISCTKGRHRSVAMAEILKKYIYPMAQIQHLTL